MIDSRFIGHELQPHTVEIEKGRLRLFAKATGQSDPVYTDEGAAKSAGYRSLPVPPTMLFGLDIEAPESFEIFVTMGVDVRRVLHGEQHFRYHAQACAGDTLTFATRISDIYSKKGGALEFVVKDTNVTNQHGDLVAEMRRVIVVRNG